jgi:hypothetical protein
MAKRDATGDQAAAPAQDPPVLVYIEIPDCGAEALYEGFQANRPRAEERTAVSDMFVGGGGIERRDMKQLRRAAKKLRVKGLNVVRGRFPYVVSEYLERLEEKREFRYATFLDDPVQRTLAEYLRATEACPRGFGEALRAGVVYDNLQTRMLSTSETPFAYVTDEMLEQAKGNLRDGFHWFGLADRLEESLVLARRRLGLRDAMYRAGAPAAPTPGAVDPEVRAAAERANAYDLELYAYAQDLFAEAPEFDDLEFQVELAVMRGIRGTIDLATEPPPPGFDGGEEEWRMLAEARTEIMRLEWELEEEARAGVTSAGNGHAPEDEAADG